MLSTNCTRTFKFNLNESQIHLCFKQDSFILNSFKVETKFTLYCC